MKALDSKTLDHALRLGLGAWALGLVLLVVVRPVLALPLAHLAVRGAAGLWITGGLVFLVGALLRCTSGGPSDPERLARLQPGPEADASVWIRRG